MLTVRRSFLAAVLGLAAALAGCAALPTPPTAAERQALAPEGRLRVGTFPQSPTKGVTMELGKALAARLGVAYELVELKSQAELLAAVRTAKVDFGGTNASAARVAEMDFSTTVLDIELGYLVVPGSRVATLADVDQGGVRIGVTQGSTSQTTLPRLLRNASVVPVPSMTQAREMLTARTIDTYATNKSILTALSTGLQGARILDGNWGVEHWAVCIPKGRDAGRAYLQRFTELARADGLVQRAIDTHGVFGAVLPKP